MFLPHPRVKVSIVGSLRDREVACSASDRQGSNFESCVWRTVSSQSSHHPQEVLLARFSLYVHKGGLKPDSFHFSSIPAARPWLFPWYFQDPEIRSVEVHTADEGYLILRACQILPPDRFDRVQFINNTFYRFLLSTFLCFPSRLSNMWLNPFRPTFNWSLNWIAINLGTLHHGVCLTL